LHANITPSRILIIYNADYIDDGDNDGVQDSLQVAQYYAAKRNVPVSNIVGIHVGGNITSIAYADFYNEMFLPLQAELNSRGPDSIDVLLLCYGLPYSIPSNDGPTGVSVDNQLGGFGFITPS